MDGGGTRTTAWVADERGRIVGRSQAGPSNPLKVGLDASQRVMLRAARLAMRQARLSRLRASRTRERRSGIEAVAVGLAGVDRPQVHRPLLAWLRRSVPARFHLLTSDAAIALEAAVGSSPGIIVISGTGSIGYGRDESGRVLRAGGWGSLFDDEGSGHDLGRRAVAAALRAADGRGPYTRLTAKICRALKLKEIDRVILRPLEPYQIAALFPLVLEAARERDRVALELCEEAGRELAGVAVALLKRFGWLDRAVPVACAGGVFASSPRIRRSFTRHLRLRAPLAHVMTLRRPAVAGAIRLARALVSREDTTSARSKRRPNAEN